MKGAAVVLAASLCGGCGVVFGVDAIEKRATATHDGAGINALVIDVDLQTDIEVSGGSDDFTAVMNTIEWRSPTDDDAPARSSIELVERSGMLELETAGGGESVTLRSIDVFAPADVTLDVIVDADHLRVRDFDSDVYLENDGQITAEGMRGNLVVRTGEHEIDVGVTGTFDLDTSDPITARVAGEGVISTDDRIDLELIGPLSGELFVETIGEAGVDARIPAGLGVTLELSTGVGSLRIEVGDTSVSVSEELDTQIIEIGGGGPRLIIDARGPITILEPGAL